MPGYFFDPEQKSRFSGCVHQMEAMAGKVRFRGSRKPFELKISGMDARAKIVENSLVSSKKILIISLQGKIPGASAMEKKFGIRFAEEGSKNYNQLNITYRKM